MDAQQIFDTVVAHLNKQGHPARNVGGDCMYLAPNGDMCAVGCLLGDTYDPQMEGGVVAELVSEYELPFGQHVELLTSLQCAHDYCIDVKDLNAALVSIAKRYNLQFDQRNITNWQR